MAKNKTYLVYGGNGEELSTLKTLAAAKKLADEEGGTVLCDGECVYKATKSVPAEPEQISEETVEPAEVVETVEPAEVKNVEKYRLKTLMNIRKEPAMSGAKVGTAPAGTVVAVREVKNDWLHLTDGTFILYGAGRFAERV